MPLAEEERADLLVLLRELTPAQWDAWSLGSGWRVRDVATHVVSYDELSRAATAATFVRGGSRARVVNEVAQARYRSLDPVGIVALVARNQRPSGLASGFRGGIALTDGTIHQQDVRRALGLPRAIPEHRLVPVLTLACRSCATAWDRAEERPVRPGPGAIVSAGAWSAMLPLHPDVQAPSDAATAFPAVPGRDDPAHPRAGALQRPGLGSIASGGPAGTPPAGAALVSGRAAAGLAG